MQSPGNRGGRVAETSSNMADTERAKLNGGGHFESHSSHVVIDDAGANQKKDDHPPRQLKTQVVRI